MWADQHQDIRPSEPVPTETVRRRIREQLGEAKRRVDEEIRSYPTPIAGCDVQFNSLLEQQRELSQELDRLAAMCDGTRTDAELAQALDEFVVSSAVLRDDERQALAADMRRGRDDSRA